MKKNLQNSKQSKFWQLGKGLLTSILLITTMDSVNAQFVHPGITHKTSDLDRIKFMVESQIDPWYSSYQEMVADSKSSYDYTVQGDASFTELGRDDGTNYNAWNSDIRAAYYNAILWYVTGDSRHADKAVEIFNAWKNLTSVTSGGTDALSGGIGYIMIEAAELIKSTYSGWSASDIQDFKDMLVYPGYSTTSAPSGDITFYWMSYQGDPIRHGNQGLSGWRTVMAMGIFLDNEIMYDRALRYVQGLPHRSDDLAYPAGPNTSDAIIASDDFADTYSVTRGYSEEDYGYNEVLTNYIWETGQCQESSRDHQHTAFGIGLLTSMAEMAWNQGDDLYSYADDRLLLGLEYNMRYNTSYLKSYSDQSTPWNPTVASGEFREGFDRTGRWYSKAMSTTSVGGYIDVRPVYESPLAHYYGRGFKTADETKWLTRGRDLQIELGGYEDAGFKNDALGWGALVARRPDYCYGDPISGFDTDALPIYAMNVLPMTIEAENFDYSILDQEDRTYNETTTANKGNKYRTGEAVDIETCDNGGYNVGWIANGEWLTYTVYVPNTGTYDISMSVASKSSTGTVKVLFGGSDKTGFVSVPNTTDYQVWDELVLGEAVTLTQGVQSMKILVGTGGFNIDNITISESIVEFVPDPNKTYYIDCPVHDLRLAASGESEDGYTTATSTTGDDVEWKFVDKGNGYWHIDRAAGGSKPRLRTDNSQYADMQQTTYSGSYTYYEFSEGASNGTYFLTLPDGPTSYKRLQVDNSGIIKMVSTASAGTWESFLFTEVAEMQTVTIQENETGFCSVDGTVDNNNAGFTGDGFANTTNELSTGVDWEIDGSAGDYTFVWGYASTTDRPGNLVVDGSIVSSNVAFSSTGSWTTWSTQSATVTLSSGVKSVRLEAVTTSGLGNIDYVKVAGPDAAVSDCLKSARLSAEKESPTKLIFYPNPVSDYLNVANSKDSKVTVYNSVGKLVFSSNIESNNQSIDMNNMQRGIYLVRLIKNGDVINQKIVKQ